MRRALEALLESEGPPDHIGLAYDSWAPVDSSGKVAEDKRTEWLGRLAGTAMPPDYERFFKLWKDSFRCPPDRTFELRLASRLLVGHGNASATEVGLTVHHTWGVPMIPGSALKGLLAHYVDAVYGPGDPRRPPWEQSEDERPRVDYQGIAWKGRRIQRGPGEVYRRLFGAPEAEEDEAMRQHDLEAGASAGLVTFHDALYIPGSATEDKPFAVDVLTVHQKIYYGTSGQHWPCDYDDPNPVAFLTVRPGVKMFLALSGPPDWSELAERLLRDALAKWGVGGKTSAGYGRLIPAEGRGSAADQEHTLPSRPRHQRGERVLVTRVEDPTGKGKIRFRVDDGFPGHFANEEPPPAEIGQHVQVWIANASPQGYTLTLRPPKKQAKGAK
jgi:CRISPR-associated protein Cmr6